MRKKWTYVAIVSMMLGVAPVFTGCVDTDEPAGLENLRGAKADLLRAKAAVQEALAKVEEANARYRDQETAWLKAKTDYETQVAREKELQNDLLEAQNEFEKQKAEAAYQAYLEELARQKELLDAQLAADLKQAEADMMQAEINLETLRQELELAKISGTEATQATIAALQADVETAYVKLYGGYLPATNTSTSTTEEWWGESTTTTTTEGRKKVIGALPEYYYAKKAEQEALAYQAQGFDCSIKKKKDGSYTVTAKSEGTEWTGTLSAYVEQARAELDAANKLLTDLETYGDKEVEGTDWKAEVAKLQAEIDKLEQDLSVQLAQLDQAHATPEYLAADQAVNGVWKEESKDWTPAEGMENGVDYKEIKEKGQIVGYNVLVEKGALQILDDAKDKLMEAQKNEVEGEEYVFTYDAYQAATPVTDIMKTSINAAVKALNKKLPTTASEDEKYDNINWKIGFAYEKAADDLSWGAKTEGDKDIPATREDEPDAIKTITTNFNQWIDIVDEATIDPNEVGQAQAMLTRAKADQEEALKAYNGARDIWKELVGIVTNESAHSVPTTDLKKSTDAYSLAFKALDDAITSWNEAVDKAYSDAETLARTDWKLDEMYEAIQSDYRMPETFNKDAFVTSWDNILKNFPNRKTETEFNSLVVESFGDIQNVATISANYLGVLGDYADAQMTLDEDGKEADVLAAAKDAVTVDTKTYFDKDKTYETKISTALSGIKAAVWTGTGTNASVSSLNDAIDEFNELAETYVQIPVDKKAQLISTLIDKPNDKGETSGFVNEDSTEDAAYLTSAIDNTGKKKYTIQVVDLTTDKINNATKTKYNTEDPDAGKDALIAKSITVFGIAQERYAEPSRAEIEKDVKKHADDVVGTDSETGKDITYQDRYEASFAGQLFAANDAVEGYQNQIDASDDLQALHDELVAARDAFKKSIDEQYAANFGDMEAAIDAAEKDLEEKQAALDEEDAKFNDIDIEIAKLQAQIKAENELLETLQLAAWKYLGITWPEEGTQKPGNLDSVTMPDYSDPSGLKYDPECFAEQLQNAIEYQKLVVADAEKNLALAQAEYDKAAATGYNGSDLAAMYVQAADAKRKTAEEAYTRALTALQNALDILAGSDATEQPAE